MRGLQANVQSSRGEWACANEQTYSGSAQTVRPLCTYRSKARPQALTGRCEAPDPNGLSLKGTPMLRSLKDLENYTIDATDGLIGHVKDFYFDDDAWVVRYFVVDAGTWLSSRKVLITPISVHEPNWLKRTLAVSISKEQVKNSPNVDTDKPVSRQNEEQFLGYYGYANYWEGVGMWGGGLYPYAMVPGYVDQRIDRVEREREEEAALRAERLRHRNDDPNLRSGNAVTGYHIKATDGELGHVAGFLVDDHTWAIRYLVVDTSQWWGGHKVLIAPEWITGVDWTTETVSVDLTRDAIKRAPPYDATVQWSRELDESLYEHYGKYSYHAGPPLFASQV